MHTTHCDHTPCCHQAPRQGHHDDRCFVRRDQRDVMRKMIERAHQLYHDPCAPRCAVDKAIEEAFRASQY